MCERYNRGERGGWGEVGSVPVATSFIGERRGMGGPEGGDSQKADGHSEGSSLPIS